MATTIESEKHGHTIDLSDTTTTVDSDTDIDVGELIGTEKKNGLDSLQFEALGLDDINGGTIDLDETVTGLAVSNSNSSDFSFTFHCLLSKLIYSRIINFKAKILWVNSLTERMVRKTEFPEWFPQFVFLKFI